MSENFSDLLEDTVNDRYSGAWVVTRKAIRCVEALMREHGTSPAEEIISSIEKTATEILKAQPGMAQLTHLFNVIFDTIDLESGSEQLVLSRKICGEVKRFREQATDAVARVAEFGADLIEEDSQIFIHSNSSTILQIIQKAHELGKTFDILLTESRPVNEGKVCATELAKLGIHSTYFVDAASGRAIERADLVLLGADSLSEVRLVNKVGTKSICLLARELVVPCYAACESSKFIPQKLGPRKERSRNPKEVWENPPPETVVDNHYFDEVSVELFNGIITEEGILTPQEIGGRISSQTMNKRLLEMLR